MPKLLHVYVCNTYRDLLSERKALADALEKLNSQFQSFTYTCSRSIQHLSTTKKDLSRSQVLIFLVGHMQGPMTPGEDITYTEAEYNEGIKEGKEILVYFRDEKKGLYPAHFERDIGRIQQLNAFKEKLSKKHNPKIFTDLPSLVALVNSDLNKKIGEFGLEAKPVTQRVQHNLNVKRKSESLETNFAKEPIPSKSNIEVDFSTRTIPIYQKALATPFTIRKKNLQNRTKIIFSFILLVIVSALSLANFHKSSVLPNFTPVHFTQKKTDSIIPSRSTNPIEMSKVTEGNTSNPTLAPTLMPAKAIPTSTVILMEDPDTSAVIIRKALSGTAEEQFLAGQMYEEGKIVPANDSMAFHWFRRAAEQGWAEAQFKTGSLYRIGKGTVRSSVQAARWFKAAADQGFAKAQVQLGELYQAGKGVERNETSAFKLFLKAAAQKDPDAEKILAELKEE